MIEGIVADLIKLIHPFYLFDNFFTHLLSNDISITPNTPPTLFKQLLKHP